MSHKQILTDYSGPIRWNLQESDSSGKLYVEGKVGQAGKPTANGRVYGEAIMAREIKRLQPKISGGSLVGSLDHPGDGKSRLRDAAHICRDLRIEKDGSIHGKFEIVEECDNGRNLGAFLRRGASIGMSSRGMGSTSPAKDGNGDVVGEDFRLTTFDFVADPAVSDAYPALVSESEEGKKPTVDDIRSRYPELIKDIEENAYAVAQHVTETVFEDEKATIGDETLDAYGSKVREELFAEAKEQLSDDFSLKLVRALQGLRKDIEEEVRSDMASDPTVAGAKITLESIARLVSPFNPTPDVQALIADKDGEIRALTTSVDEAKAEAEAVDEKARLLAWNLFVERKIGARPDAASIREMLGDLSNVKTAADLQEKVARAVEIADQAQEEAEVKIESAKEAGRERFDRLKEDYDHIRKASNERSTDLADTIKDLKDTWESRENSLREEIEDLRSDLSEARGQSEELEARSYAQERTIGHPRRSAVLDEVRSGRARSRSEIDNLAESFDEMGHEGGGVHERVRRKMSSGREYLKESSSDVNGTSGGRRIADLEDLGIDLAEITRSFDKSTR